MTSPAIAVKVVLLGQSTVGKTCIATRYVRGVFQSSTISTVGASYLTKSFKIDSDQYDFNIWDTAGQELYRSLTPMYYRNAHIAFVVYDVTVKSSFEAAEKWIADLREGNASIYIILLANKVDLTEQRIVDKQEGLELAEKCGVPYFETSAATGVGIDQAFQKAIEQVGTNQKLREKILPNSEPKQISAQEEEKKSEGGCCS